MHIETSSSLGFLLRALVSPPVLDCPSWSRTALDPSSTTCSREPRTRTKGSWTQGRGSPLRGGVSILAKAGLATGQPQRPPPVRHLLPGACSLSGFRHARCICQTVGAPSVGGCPVRCLVGPGGEGQCRVQGAPAPPCPAVALRALGHWGTGLAAGDAQLPNTCLGHGNLASPHLAGGPPVAHVSGGGVLWESRWPRPSGAGWGRSVVEGRGLTFPGASLDS